MERVAAQKQARQQLQAILEAQQASATQRENALQAQLADLSNILNMNAAEAAAASVEPEPPGSRHRRSSIEPQAFSKFSCFDSEAASITDWAFKFENMTAAVFTSSRDARLDSTSGNAHTCRWRHRTRFRLRGNQSTARIRLGSLAETREEVWSAESGPETDAADLHSQSWNSASA